METVNQPVDEGADFPNMFLIGAPKSGTTSVFSYLIQHPDVYSSAVKETHFFKDDEQFDLGIDFYKKKYFAGAENYRIRGDATPAYLPLARKVAPRISEAVAGRRCRFIVILRNPVDRAWSNYLHRVRNGAEKLSFRDALADEYRRKSENEPIFSQYFEQGLYAKHLDVWFGLFPRESFGIYYYDELENIDVFMSKVFKFLEISENVNINTSKRHNIASEPRLRSLSTIAQTIPGRQALFDIFVPEHKRKIVRYKIRQLLLKPIDSDRKQRLCDEDRLILESRYSEDSKKLLNLLEPSVPPWLVV